MASVVFVLFKRGVFIFKKITPLSLNFRIHLNLISFVTLVCTKPVCFYMYKHWIDVKHISRALHTVYRLFEGTSNKFYFDKQHYNRTDTRYIYRSAALESDNGFIWRGGGGATCHSKNLILFF